MNVQVKPNYPGRSSHVRTLRPILLSIFGRPEVLLTYLPTDLQRRFPHSRLAARAGLRIHLGTFLPALWSEVRL